MNNREYSFKINGYDDDDDRSTSFTMEIAFTKLQNSIKL